MREKNGRTAAGGGGGAGYLHFYTPKPWQHNIMSVSSKTFCRLLLCTPYTLSLNTAGLSNIGKYFAFIRTVQQLRENEVRELSTLLPFKKTTVFYFVV